ncbi:MAG: zinc ribbon domain-containing protein [Bacteroidota bacterium]|jgi:predicted  nucleic acid-binding Zn-ribbon protein
MPATKEYSVEEKLKGLVHLQKIESKLDEIQILKGELPMEVKDLEDEIAGLNARRLRIEEEINGIQEFIEGRKNAIKESQDLLKKYEKQSDNVKNNREFEAINKEIEMQSLEIKLAEKHIKDANEDLLEKSQQHENINKTIGGKEKNLEHKKGELDKIIADNEKEEKHLNKEIDKARQAVEERLLASYERIRKSYRNGLAVVPIVRDSCGGCFNTIPPQRQSEIRQRKKIIVCENCGRIMVDNEINDSVTL